MLAWIAGVALQLQQPVLWPLSVYGGLVLLAAALALAAAGRPLAAWRTVVPLVLAGALAGAGTTDMRAALHAGQALDPGLENVNLQVTGRVSALPVRTAQGVRFEFEVERALHEGREVRVPPRLLLAWHRSPFPAHDRPGQPGAPAAVPSAAPLLAGDRWLLTVRLKRPHGLANPHGFDRERWLWEQGVGATGSVRSGARDSVPRHLAATARHPLQRARQQVDQAIAARVADSRSAGVLSALVVGNQSAIEREDWEVFRTTGVAHLMAISGLHVTMFAWVAVALVGWLWRALALVWPAALLALPAPWAAGVGGIALATVYALFSGWAVPSQRTVIMLLVVIGLRLHTRQWPWPAVWLTAMVVVLLLDPWALMHPGFWLSFVAVGILFASDPGRRLPGGTSEAQPAAPPRWRRALARGTGLLREQAVVTVALAPLTLMLFGQFSVVGLVANLVAIPWVTLLVTPLAMFGVVWAPLWDLAAWTVQMLGLWLQFLAGWPWSAVHRPITPWPMAVLAMAGGILMVLRLPPVFRLAGWLMVWPVLWWSPERPPHGHFEMMAIDVGQGSAVLVRTARHSLLYDTGPRYSSDSDAGERVVVPLLHALGVRLDAVVVSHSDGDHAGGMEAVRLAQPQARWLSSFDADPQRRCVAGQRWDWDGVRFEVLHPRPRHYGADGRGALSSNAMSCVLHVVAGEHSAWLGGDIDAAQEVRLALERPQMRATVLLAPHHGSLTSSSPVLLNTLQPAWVVAQAGHLNRFRHPAPRVLARYRQRGIPWVVSADCGAATWRSDDPGRMHCHRDARRRYWHHPGSGHPPAGSADGVVPH
ncbi:MAG: DNA internalization-related competence protein ComEC/Rec2 [Burkholderiales bacterium]|nr:MAG: DNA internalization-related competence protein ComEC/Rec2 [Burkholderiales bacterium]